MGNKLWFEEEVNKVEHTQRIGKVTTHKSYLMGVHDVLSRGDYTYKGEEYKTSKIVLQNLKNIIKFHSNYILGNPISLIGSDDKVEMFGKIHRKGKYKYVNKKILDSLIKYGDAYEYVYKDNGIIKSKIIDASDAFPVYDDNLNYVAFIEHWVDAISRVGYYTVYTKDTVEKWINDGDNIKMTDSFKNISGLPIHYKTSDNEYYEFYGYSILDDMIPIMNKIEYLLSKMDDAIYTNSMNPMPVVSGQRIETSVDADAMGYLLNLEDGSEFKYAIANLDSDSIKLLLDSLYNNLYDVANVPSVLFKNTNVANVSEVSLSLMFAKTDAFASDIIYSLEEGLEQRFEIFESLVNMEYNIDSYVDVVFTTKKPMDIKEMIENMKIQYDMGALSKETVIEKSPYSEDVTVEKSRLDIE